MSILIKGMETPKNCGACPLRLAWCRERIYMVNRPQRCPLIELPPHGRLIDADALMLEFDKSQKSYDGHGRPFSDAFMVGNEICAEWWAVERKVEDAPTVIEATNIEAEEGDANASM